MCPRLKSHPLVQIPKSFPLYMSDCWRPRGPVVVKTYALASLGLGPVLESLGGSSVKFLGHLQWWSGPP